MGARKGILEISKARGRAGWRVLAVMLRSGTIGLLYDLGETQPYECIAFVPFDTRWLQGKSK
jgi:hypothetical protein